MREIIALIHTEGVILKSKYFILELAYSDILGVKKHFLIRSPMCYLEAKKYNNYLHKSLEVVMCRSEKYFGDYVYTFKEVLQFLKTRYNFLTYYYGQFILFGYKGKSFQRNVLDVCQIPCVNIEYFGIPCIKNLILMFPNVYKRCFYHKNYNNKCAEHILRLFEVYIYLHKIPLCITNYDTRNYYL